MYKPNTVHARTHYIAHKSRPLRFAALFLGDDNNNNNTTTTIECCLDIH